MKIVIEHEQVKRAIDGSWGLCGSRADLERVVDELRGALANSDWSYGWVSIAPRHPAASGEPLPWRDRR